MRSNLVRAVVFAVFLATVGPSTVANAGSGHSVCGLNYYCINKNGVAFGYIGTSMIQGWRHYPGNASSGTVYTTSSDTYSNGGGNLGNVGTIRNRNNITGRIMCTIDFVPGFGYVFGSKKASWYTDYWVNVFSGEGAGFYWMNSSTTC